MEVVVQGVEYRSLFQACEAYNASRNKVRAFMKKNNVPAEYAILMNAGLRKEAIHIKRIDLAVPDSVIGWNGEGYVLGDEVYPTFQQMCQARGLISNLKTIQSWLLDAWEYRYYCGLPIVVDEIWEDVRQRDVRLSERKYGIQSMKKAMDAINQQLAGRQIQNINDAARKVAFAGASPEDVIRESECQYWTYEGKKYYNLIDYAKAQGLDVQVNEPTIRARLDAGWNLPDSVINYRIEGRRKKLPPVTKEMWGWNEAHHAFIGPDGKAYTSRRQMVMAFLGSADSHMSNVTRRLAYGIPLEQALQKELPAQTKGFSQHVKCKDFGYDATHDAFTLDGINFYPDIKTMCQANGVSTLMWRITCESSLDKQWTLDHRDLAFEKIHLPHQKELVSLTTAALRCNMASQTVLFKLLTEQYESLQEAFDAARKEKKVREKEKKNKI